MYGKIRTICAVIPLFLILLFIPSSAFTATCNTVDGVVYGYAYDMGGEITDYSMLDPSCETEVLGDAVGDDDGVCEPGELCVGVGPGDDICNVQGSGGGGCAAASVAPGSPYEITVGIQNQGGAADRYQISWTPPVWWSIVMQERILNDGSITGYSAEVLGDATGDDDGVCEIGEVCIVEYPNEILGDAIGDDDGACELGEACGPTTVTVPTATPGNPPSYNPGEATFFTFKVWPPSNFLDSQEVIFDIASLNIDYVDSVKAVINSRDILPPNQVVLSMSNIADTSVRVGWTAPGDGRRIFFDDFSDGTLSPWSQLQNGVVAVVDDEGNYVLRKTTNTDPSGGWAPLQQTVGDFDLILYTKHMPPLYNWAARNRYSITDASGNGYGLFIDFRYGDLYIDRRDAWVGTTLGASVSGGLTVGQWYTLRFRKVGQSLTAEAYIGRVDPVAATPAATVSVSDSTWSSFNQVNINGGYDYDTDDVLVNTLDIPAASYDLRYSTSQITTEADFENAVRVSSCEPGESDLGRPKSPGNPESCTVTDLFAGTRYFFAIKTYDETGNATLSICPDNLLSCQAVTVTSGDITRPGRITDLNATGDTEDTVDLCWTAAEDDVTAVFSDDFDSPFDSSDGIGTLYPWSQLQNGVIDVVDDGGNYVLRKTTNTDPNGGWAPLQQTVGDFDLILYTKYVPPLYNWAARNRYSITDASGNGYGLFIDFRYGNLYIDRRDAWVGTTLEASVSGGLAIGEWYTLRFRKIGQSLIAEAYIGRVDPATATPAATVSASDSTWSSFNQVNVNGGYDYYTDDVRVNTIDTLATGYILKYSTKYIVDDGVTPGMGEVSFSNATSVEGLESPGSPGSQECYTIKVQNILAGNDGIFDTTDDIDRTPNTQFFFAVKARDENYNLAPLSNIASGFTAMSSYLYNMVSVPKVPSPNDPASVFGDDVGSQLYLYRWDSRGIDYNQGCYDGLKAGSSGQYNPYNVVPACTGISAINVGKGYFLWSPMLNVVLDAPSGSTEVCANPSLCICVDESGQSFTCYTFALEEGWNMFGNPFGREVDVNGGVNKIYVQDSSGFIKSFPNAVAAGWIEGAIYTHNGVNYTDEACNSVSCNVVLQPWKGYWIWVKGGQGYRLLIPKP